MRIAYFDCHAGAAGDMILGALLDAGAPCRDVRRLLSCLPVETFRFSRRRVLRGGIQSLKVTFTPARKGKPRRAPVRYHELRRLLRGAALPPAVRDKSLRVFEALGKAEAKAHGTTLPKVHFHEVGSLDSVLDVVGSIAALELLEVRQCYSSPLPWSQGSVPTEHGELPLPAPATLELMRGIPIRPLGREGEWVTPTGAALLKTLSDDFGEPPPLSIGSIGYGAGQRNPAGFPNVLRVLIGETADAREADRVWLLETNLDDVTGEVAGHLFDRLLEVGALEVFLTPIQMKKSRPGMVISALAEEGKREEVERLLIFEAGTFGVRRHPVERRKLRRKIETVRTSLGRVRMKSGYLAGRLVTRTPEYEDCRRIARARNLPLREVYRQVILEAEP